MGDQGQNAKRGRSVSIVLNQSTTVAGKKSRSGQLAGKKSRSAELTGLKKGSKAKVSNVALGPSITRFLEEYSATHVPGEEDEWTWESYTPEEEEVKEVKPPEPEPAKKKKKEEAPPETPTEREDTVSRGTDIMAQIMRLKLEAEAKARRELGGEEEEVVEVEPSEKSKRTQYEELLEKREKAPGKFTKKQREMLKELQKEAELETKQAEEDERKRVIKETKIAVEKEKRETMEQTLRHEQLGTSLCVLNSIYNSSWKWAYARELQDQEQQGKHVFTHQTPKPRGCQPCQLASVTMWDQYMKSDGMPNLYECKELSTYLHLWEKIIETSSLEEVATKTEESLRLLDEVTELIETSVGMRPVDIENWRWIQEELRRFQGRNIDNLTYRMLKNIVENFCRINIPTADVMVQEEFYTLYIFLRVILPPSLHNPKLAPPPQIRLAPPGMNMTVSFPPKLKLHRQAIRLMYLKYNHLNFLCATYEPPPEPEAFARDLLYVTQQEWYSKLFYKWEQHPKPPKPKRKKGQPEEPQEVVNKELGIIPIVPYQKLDPTASETVIANEERMYISLRDSMKTHAPVNVINLRQYLVIGGIYFMDLYYHPPQPQPRVSMEFSIQRFILPKKIKEGNIHIPYTPPAPLDPDDYRKPADYLLAVEKQEQYRNTITRVIVKLPSHVLWLQTPTICVWDRKKLVWNIDDIHEVSHDKEGDTLDFKLGKFGWFSFAIDRHLNMPFKDWEMIPQDDGSVSFCLEAAILKFTFNIKDDRICIRKMEKAPSNSLNCLLGVYYRLPRLIRILRERGVDLFPDFDTFCYVEGTCEKHWPLERHTYCIMGHMSSFYDFAWTQWNMTTGRRALMMQIREHKKTYSKPGPYSMAMITPLQAAFIDLTEESVGLNGEPMERLPFFSDLYHLLKSTAKMALKTKFQNVSPQLATTVAGFLMATRVLSLA